MPASVTIQNNIANYNTGPGTAMAVLTLVEMLTVIAVVLGIFRLVTPKGWRRIGWSEVQT